MSYWHSLVSLVGLSLALHPTTVNAQGIPPRRTLAASGDSVWVIVNFIKPDKRAQYQRFVQEIFWPGAARLSPAEQHVFLQTRVLDAVRPEADGTYAYAFIMDPVQHGASYSIDKYVKKMYGEAKGAEYLKLFSESLARKSEQYHLVQTRF
jgi:hypothetical protein